MRKIFTLLPLTAALLLTGCVSLAPDYERPQAPVEEAWPQDEAVKNAKLLTEGLADWASFFTDARLKKLIEQGLAQNRSLRSAFYSVEEARAQYGVSRAELFPSVAAAAGESAARSVSRMGSSINRTYSATAMASYELDLFGRVRNLNEMALQAFFQTQAAQRTVQMTVITDIAQTWLALGASKMQYKLARETLTSQEESYRLIVRSYELGASSQLDVQQAAQTVAAAQAAAVQAERAVSQYRNALRLLVGGTYDPALEPEGIETATVAAVSVAGNIPSEVLLNRPDIAQAEVVLRSANANIGVARAAFFPSISLTGAFGGGSTQLSDLFDHATKIWSWAPQISLPIFTGGANISNLRAAEARQKSALADYEAAIQAAFKDVADALAMEGTVERELSARRDFAKAAAESYRLATDRYKNGADSYLSVLDSQRTNFSAQQALITAELSRAASLITLYKAMGGASELAEPEGESK